MPSKKNISKTKEESSKENLSKGRRQKRFSGFCPLTDNHFAKKPLADNPQKNF